MSLVFISDKHKLLEAKTKDKTKKCNEVCDISISLRRYAVAEQNQIQKKILLRDSYPLLFFLCLCR